MKNILKYTAAAVMALSLAACEEFEDHTQTVSGASKLAYVNAGEGNVFSVKVTHRPEGSSGTFSTEFGFSSNTPVHGAAHLRLVYDADLVETYNAEHDTACAVLPEEYLVLDNATLTLAENALKTEETVKVSLSAEADLRKLTERYYLAPLRIESDGLAVSEAWGAVYLLVETEKNIVRPIESIDQMTGFPAVGRSSWLADCAGFRTMFDGDAATACEFDKLRGNVMVIDMQAPQLVTGLTLGTGSSYSIPSAVSIEYSLDGETYSQAGTPVEGQYATENSMMYIALEQTVEAQYLRLTVDFSSESYQKIAELNIYKVDSSEPAVYAVTGNENTLTGKITHKKGVGSSSDLEASFKAYATVASASGYSVTFAEDASLVDAYNKANGTSYAALPAGYLTLENAPLAIATDACVSEGEVKATLTGDLSQLTEKSGYLAALRLSAAGAESSASRGVVYVAIAVENNVIRGIRSVDEMIGFPAAGRATWTADCDDFSKLFDGDNSSRISFAASGNELTVDMQQSHLVTGLHLHTYSIAPMAIEYSIDGQNFETAGTVAAGESIYTGSSWSAGDYYVAFADYLDARYLRLKFGFSGSRRYIDELEVIEIESDEPTIYAQCGTDNVLTGTLTHHTTAGAINGVNASFDVLTTISSPAGYSVSAAADNSLVAAYNAAHGTSYAELPAANVRIEGTPCTIAAGANRSAGQISVTLRGDLSGLTNAKGYLIPVTLSTDSGVVSSGRGTVYVVVNVETSSELFMKNFTPDAITGTLVADRSGWNLLAFDDSIHSSTDNMGYAALFDGDPESYIRTWGGPVSFTVDMGRVYDMTGIQFISSTWSGQYAPSSVMIEYSLDGTEYTALGTPMQSDGQIAVALPTSYIALYDAVKVRYLKIVASYSSNMGTGEFNIYAK